MAIRRRLERLEHHFGAYDAEEEALVQEALARVSNEELYALRDAISRQDAGEEPTEQDRMAVEVLKRRLQEVREETGGDG